MLTFLKNMFASGQFIPHGHCYLWQPELVWLHILSDSIIGFAYYSIPIALIYFVFKRQDLPFHWIFFLFSAFIVACGTTHLMEIWTLWHPVYWLSGALKAITALVSLYIALILIPVIPKILAIPSPAQLEKMNLELQHQILERQQAEETLQKVNEELEIRVSNRTLELAKANQELQQEIQQRLEMEVEIRKSEERFRATFNSAAVGIAHIDINGQWLLVNQKLCEIVGYTQQEMLERTFQSITDPDDLETDLKYVHQMLAGEIATYSLEKRYIHKNNTHIWINLTVSLVRKASGEPEYFIAVVQDITARKQTKAALQQKNELLQAIFDNVPVMICLFDPNGNFQWANREFGTVFGWRVEDIQGRNLLPEFYPDPEYLQYVLDFIAAAERSWGEFQTCTREGRILDTTWANVYLKDGTTIGIGQDISDRKLAEQKLAMSESQYRLLFERNPNPMWIFDPQTLTFLAVNQAAIAHYGYSQSEFLSMTIANILPPEDIPAFQDMIKHYRLNDSEFVYQGEWRHRKRDGSIINVEITSRRIIWEGKLAEFVMVKDITERKQAEEKLQTYAAELEELYNNAPCGYHSLDKDGVFIRINDTELKMLGYSREEVVGKIKFSDLLTPESLPVFESNFPQFKQGDWVRDLEFQMRCQDGTTLPISLNAIAVKDAAGDYLFSRSVVLDISERQAAQREQQQAQEALRTSEEQFRLVLNLTNTGFWDWNITTDKLLWSDNNYHLLGLIPNSVEPIYQTWRDRIHPEDIDRVEQALNHALDTQTDYEAEYRVIYPDGSHHWIMDRGRGIYDASGQPVRMVGMIFDISERKQTELALWKTQQQLQAIVNNSPAVIYLIDSQNKQILVNRSYAQLLSTTLDNLIGKSIYEAWPKENADIFAANNQRVLQGNQAIEVEENIIIAGKVYTYITIKFPLHDANGIPYAVCGISTDITERKQAQQKIREQAALIDIATDAIFVHDLENNILFWSQGSERLYGWTPEESLGKKAHELFYKQSLLQLEAVLQSTIKLGSWQGELEQITKTGREIIVASRWTLVHDETGKPRSILVVNTDITEKKQLERQFYRAQRLESIGTLASGIAHDLNNVFTPIIMIAQLLPLRCKNVDARTKELFQTLDSSSKRGANLVKQILTFARGTEGQRILLQPGHLLKELVKVIKQTFPKSIDIVTDIPTNTLWMVQGDPTQLEQVFMNLAVNARDAMPDGGTLTITAENRIIDKTYARMHLEAEEGGYFVVTVADTGTGIPPELLERIFDPFFTTKEIGKGTGLGLSTVLGIVKNHGGFVEVSSQMGKGTKFQVFLPRGEGTATETITKTELLKGNGELILVVDDEKVVQQTTQETLADYNYKTLAAKDGIEALTLYVQHEQEISAVLLDIIMPNMDGLIAIRTLRTLNPKVKIIATSGLSSNEQKATTIGANKFLSKPYTATDLVTTLSEVIF